MKLNALRLALCATCLLSTTPVLADFANWQERLGLYSDVRLRYETVEQDARPDVERSRYLVRLGAGVKVVENIKLHVSLATSSDNPTSRNITFGNRLGRDEFGLETAYVEWQASPNLALFGGKMANPMYRAGGAPLAYDSDFSPEGVALNYRNGRFFANGGAFLIEKRSASADSYLYHAQAGVDLALAGDIKLKAGIGYMDYSNTKGNMPFFLGLPRGNSVDAMDRYVYDYTNTELFAELGTKLAGRPLKLFGQYTVNNRARRENTGYAVGLKAKSLDPGRFEFSWMYQSVEADAVIGAYNDSDFGGGGTDASGHVLAAKYQLFQRIAVGAKYFVNNVGSYSGNERDYRRLQLDVVFSFD